MKQLFANNAKTTLASSIIATDTAIVVTDGSAFPNPGPYEYFLATLEISGNIEVILVTARTGNTLTVGGYVDSGSVTAGRGMEGTTAQAFAAGARVECRVTKNTLANTSKGLYSLPGVDQMVAPKDSYQDSYIIGTFDPSGNPVVAMAKDLYTWRFLNYTSQLSKTATAGTTTSVSASVLSLSTVSAGRYLIQFTSGALQGQLREIASNIGNTVNWSNGTATAPQVGDTFEILEANTSIMSSFLASSGIPVGDNSGTADAITITYSPAIGALTDNLMLAMVLSSANTSATPTFSPNGLTAKIITAADGSALVAGQLVGTVIVRYDSGTDKWSIVGAQSSATTAVQALSFFIGNL